MPTLTLAKKDGGFVNHSVPDVAQDVVVLESATQTISGKTLNPGSGGMIIALADGWPVADSGTVHIWKGSAGAINPPTGSVLVLENSGDANQSFLTPSGNLARIRFGDESDASAGGFSYAHTGDILSFRVGSSNRLNYSAGAFAFQEDTVISTTAGQLILAGAASNLSTKNFIIADSVKLYIGTTADTALMHRTNTLAADAELAGVIEGTSNHQGVAANSMIVSGLTNNGDMMFLVSDGGNSVEMIKMTGATAELSLGWGALKIGLGADLAAITRPASVSADAASIITALINLGLFTA